MTPHVLSFPCPSPLRRDVTFQRLLEADPRNIYNAYPDLADILSLGQARTQPLPRMTYLPNYTSTVEERLIVCHEVGHFLWDFTPFKVWGRYLLCCAYEWIYVLLRATEWDEETQESWNKIKWIRHELERAFYSFSLSEELLATSISFDFTDMQQYEKAVVQKAAENFPNADFEGLYFKTFKPLMKLRKGSGFLFISLGFFLQAVRVLKTGYEVIDSDSRCKLLDESISEFKNAQQVID
jgi:hypothetical protein